jgi:hypothetical protein
LSAIKFPLIEPPAFYRTAGSGVASWTKGVDWRESSSLEAPFRKTIPIFSRSEIAGVVKVHAEHLVLYRSLQNT